MGQDHAVEVDQALGAEVEVDDVQNPAVADQNRAVEANQGAVVEAVSIL